MATITKAIADYSIAVGHGSSARGKYGVSLGSQSSQMHEGSVSIGYNADAGLILGHSSWTETNQSTNGSAWSDITYNTPSEGTTYVDIPIFVAVSNGSTTSVMVSDDGENWTPYNTSGTNLSWNAITSAVPNTGTYKEKTLFVAVGSSGSTDRIMTSANGVDWTFRTATTNDWKDITHGIPREGIYINTTVFVAVATDGTGNRVMTSDDGESWTGRDTTNKDLEWCSITSGVILDDESTDINETIFVAVSNGSRSESPYDNINYVLTSLDAISWSITQVSQSSISICSGVPNTGTYANKTLFVALSESGSVITSINGTTYEPATSSIGSDWTKINSGTINGITVFIAVGNSGSNRIMTSFDGYTWNLETTPDKPYVGVVSGIPGQGTYSGESIFVAISNDTGNEQVATSNFSSKNSLAIGTNATTGGESSVAFGYGATTNNSHDAIAIGKGTIGMADHSIVLGTDASANGLYNIAIGYKAGAHINEPNCISIGNNASVSNEFGIAIGQGSKTTSGQSLAIGNDATAHFYSMAIGNAAKATGSYSCAVGGAAEAIADNTVAVGTSAKATGADSIAIGSGADATEANTVAVGSAAEAKGAGSIAIGKGANTGTYTNSIALGTDSTVTNNNVICLGDGTQNVGIGTTSPEDFLHIKSTGDARFILEADSGNVDESHNPVIELRQDGGVVRSYFGHKSSSNSLTIGTTSDHIIFSTKNVDSSAIDDLNDRMIITDTGRVGIGTTVPLHPLHVAGKAYFTQGINVVGTWATIDYSDPQGDYLTNGGQVQGNAPNLNFSAFFDGAIEAQAIVVTSDGRIKDNINNINDDIALQQLRLLSPKTYTYKDTIKSGSREVIGFIAQEVREVLPRAVALGTNYIPSIMKLATAFNKEGNTIEIRLGSSLDDTVTLTTGSKIKIIINSESVETSVLSFSNDVFEISKTEEFTVTDGENVFVYGEIVDDFHFLDKNTIFTVATAALQEVDRQQQADKQRIATLESQLASVLARLDALENP